MSIDFHALIATLNPLCRQALERSAARCVQQSHYFIEIEHLLLELLDADGSDLTCLLPHVGLARPTVEAELNAVLEKVKRGCARPPAFAADTLLLLQQAWLQSTLQLREQQVRSSAVLLALFDHEALRATLLNGASSLVLIGRDLFNANWRSWCSGSAENPAGPGSTAAVGVGDAVSVTNPTPALDLYTQDLTAEAHAQKIDPIVGRDSEIRLCIDILLRRRQNNPILVGAPGVGKTAVVEGLARRIAEGDVPPPLRGVSVRVLDLALLQAGAGVMGEFEQRLKQVIAEVRTALPPVILFIDEAHTLIGAGGGAGQGDAANLLKPALARGELRTIAATTWIEYKKYIEKDPALARRFQLVLVEEPDSAQAVDMLRGVARQLERHHGVVILEAALQDAVKLSQRYIPGRQLPDKAISVLDTACARVALGQHDTPPQVEAAQRRINALDEERLRLVQESATGATHGPRLAKLGRELAEAVCALAVLRLRWHEELAAVREILQLLARLRAGVAATVATPAAAARAATSSTHTAPPPDPTPTAAADIRLTLSSDDDEHSPVLLLAQLGRLEAGLEAIRQDDPMVPVCVDSKTVAAVIAAWTGIPVGKMLADESHAVRTLHERLAQRVIGQDQALALIANRIKAYRAGLTAPDKPVGVFLLVGPSGVGKTETAYALADALYGGERNLVVVNLAEYQEAHTVSQLKGAPPGYVGYGSGGVLTEAVRRKPYSVVLLDEFEKAHPDVLEAFYNVFDKGVMEDGSGLQVDFRNTVILATSNACAELVVDACGGPRPPGLRALADTLHAGLGAVFRPALLARVAVAPYLPLGAAQVRCIIGAKLGRMAARVLAADPDFPGFDDSTIDWVAARCGASGAREIDRVIMDELVTGLADDILDRTAAWPDLLP